MTKHDAAILALYIGAVCGPLIDDASQLEIVHGQGFGDDYTFQVRVPDHQMGFMLGRQGENAEAVRRLARARARALGSRARVDVRVVSLTAV